MKSIFEKDLSGEMVSPNEPGYDALIDDIFATIKIATEMNTGYRTPAFPEISFYSLVKTDKV